MTDFKNTSSVRIFRTYDGWEDLSPEARALFLLVAQKMDSEGFPPDGFVIEAAFRMRCGNAIRELVRAEFLEITPDSFLCPWWKDSQNARKSNVLRQREFVARRDAERIKRIR